MNSWMIHVWVKQFDKYILLYRDLCTAIFFKYSNELETRCDNDGIPKQRQAFGSINIRRVSWFRIHTYLMCILNCCLLSTVVNLKPCSFSTHPGDITFGKRWLTWKKDEWASHALTLKCPWQLLVSHLVRSKTLYVQADWITKADGLRNEPKSRNWFLIDSSQARWKERKGFNAIEGNRIECFMFGMKKRRTESFQTGNIRLC